MSKAEMQKRALQEAKPVKAGSEKPEGRNSGKGKGKVGNYHLADGTESHTFLVPVPPEQQGAWHYYSPRKQVVVHGASYAYCAAVLKLQYGLDAPANPQGSSKMRFWHTVPVPAKPSKLLPKGALPTDGQWACGITSIKSWAVKAQLVLEANVSKAKAVKPQPVKAKPVKAKAVKAQADGPLLKAAETAQAPYVAQSVVDAARERAEQFVQQQQAQDAAVAKAVSATTETTEQA